MKPTYLTFPVDDSLLFIIPSTLAAQTFTSRTEWDAATCGQLVEDQFVERISEYLIANECQPKRGFWPVRPPVPNRLWLGHRLQFWFQR